MDLTLKEVTELLGQLSCELFYRMETTVKKFVQDSEKNAIRDGRSGDGVNVKMLGRF